MVAPLYGYLFCCILRRFFGGQLQLRTHTCSFHCFILHFFGDGRPVLSDCFLLPFLQYAKTICRYNILDTAKGKISISPISLLCYFFFTVLQVCSILFYAAAYAGIIATLLNVAFVMFISNYFRVDDESSSSLLPRASLFFCTGTTTLLLMCDIFPRLPHMVNATQATIAEETNRYSATILDPNELSQIILIAAGLIIATLPFIQSKGGKFAIFAMLVYLSVTGVRTNSKSYVITLVGLFAFLMFMYVRIVAQKEGAAKALTKLLPILLITLVGCVLLFIYVVIPVFDTRGSENTDLLTNRATIWGNYLDALQQRFDVSLIGVGGGNVTRVMHLVGRAGRGVPHNTYLEYFIQFGLVGILLLIVCWKTVFSSVKEKLNTNYIVPLVAFLVTAFAISVNSNDCPFILLTILALPLPEGTEKLVKNKQRSVAKEPTTA